MTAIQIGPEHRADVEHFLVSKTGRDARRWEAEDSFSLQLHDRDPQRLFDGYNTWKLFGKESRGIGSAADHVVITSWRAAITGVSDDIFETSANDLVSLIIGDREQEAAAVPTLTRRPWAIGPLWVPPGQSTGVFVRLSPETVASCRQVTQAPDARLWIHIECWT